MKPSIPSHVKQSDLLEREATHLYAATQIVSQPVIASVLTGNGRKCANLPMGPIPQVSKAASGIYFGSGPPRNANSVVVGGQAPSSRSNASSACRAPSSVSSSRCSTPSSPKPAAKSDYG